MNIGTRAMLALALLSMSALPARDAQTATVSGTVVDRDGIPIAGATASLYKDVTDTPRHWERVREGVKTDESGRFAFKEVPEGWYAVMVEREGMAKAFRYVILEAGKDFDATFNVAPPVSPVVEVRDGDGRPLAGATFRTLGVTSKNGEFWLLRPSNWKTFGFNHPRSDSAGRLQLPPMPQGSTFEAVVEHPNWAPTAVKKTKADAAQPIEVTMERGVELRMALAPIKGVTLPDRVEITLIHIPRDHPSTIKNPYPVPISDDGEIRLVVAPGKYHRLWLRHGDYIITPYYSGEWNKTSLEFSEDERVAPFIFQVLPKRIVRGNVIDDATGKPIAGAFISGETSIHELRAKLPPERQEFVDEWNHVGWAETDEIGGYEIELPPGLARLSLSHDGYDTAEPYIEFKVAAAEATPGPEIHAYPMPEVAGRVVDSNGEPVPGAIVRLRGDLRFMPPVRTDDQGRFELTPKWIPVDGETKKRVPLQPLVAFHPHKRLMAQAEADLGDPESLKELTLTLEPEPTGALLDNFRDEMSEWERDELSEELQAEKTAGSLQGEPAPPLEGTWLNAPEGTTSLEDFRGKYVLLDFWFIGCGPCHAEAPSLKLLHELYHDHDVVIIAVHNNSQSAEVVKEYLKEEGYPYPVLVDHPDGRTISRYEEHGWSGYPGYFLIGPDGKVIQDDDTVPAPTLRSYKIEILRELVLEGGKR